MNLPQSYRERMKQLLKGNYALYEESLLKKPFGGLRINTLKITPEEFERISPYSIKRVPWTENGYYYDAGEQPARHPFYHAGLYYIQEPSAMLPAAVLKASPGERVLDLCAAPGGKSTELAAGLRGEGLLVSNDISYSRAKALVKNLELEGVANGIVLSENPMALKERFPEYFDKILIDAPCSGEGMFRRDSSMIKNWENKGNESYCRIQREILDCAVCMLRPGGRLLYSTCTFSPEENEGSMAYLLEHYPEFSVVPIEGAEGFDRGRPEWVGGPRELEGCARLWPFCIEGEGHFAALVQKAESSRAAGTEKEKTGKDAKAGKPPEEIEEFFAEAGLLGQEKRYRGKKLLALEDKLYALAPESPDLKGLRVLRSGLYLGEIVGEHSKAGKGRNQNNKAPDGRRARPRFLPSQALAMCLKQDKGEGISLDPADGRAIKYLKGETIELEQTGKRGWQLIGTAGYPLGWGKVQGDTLKNKYYPGWRWQ